MIIGKKDKEYVRDLEYEVDRFEISLAKQTIRYLHDECNLTYTEIANKLNCSQQYINNIALGNVRVKNDTFINLLSRLFEK